MELQVEATGETVGEAKWAALRELEKKQPGLDKSAVRFQVVTEGERGLLGVGFAPAKVIATVSANAAPKEAEPVDESELAAEARELVTRIVDGVGVNETSPRGSQGGRRRRGGLSGPQARHARVACRALRGAGALRPRAGRPRADDGN